MLLLKVGVVARVLRSLAAFICSALYKLIAATYQLFMTISKLNVLSSDEIAPIYQRITMILTIVMTFYITFEFVKYSIQPETMTDKDKGVGNILQRIVLVVMMIAFVPTIFRLALGLQNRIIEDQIITKVLLGRSTQNYGSYGNQFSAILLSQFYEVDEDVCRNAGTGSECSQARTKVDNDLKELSRNGKIDLASDINLHATEDPGLIAILREFDPAIRFDWLFAIGVGIFVAYILVLYSIDLGARYVQLIFLQMIAPIAIMGYLLPKKDGIFQKWVKQCTTTYLDLFLRVAIIDFIILIVTVLGEAFANPDTKLGIAGLSGSMKTFTYIALVMGLLMFAQRAPKLLSELFPSSGAAGIGFGLKAANRVAPGAARAIGAGVAATRVGGALARRMVSAHNRNKANGQHSIFTKAGREERAQRKRNMATASELASMSGDTERLNKAEDKLAEAEKRLRAANMAGSTATQAEKAELEAARNAARNEYNQAKSQFEKNQAYQKDKQKFDAAGARLAAARNELNAANASGDANRIANARMALDKATGDFNSERQNMAKYDRSTSESRALNRTKEARLQTALNNLNAKKSSLELARRGNDANAIIAAQNEVNAAEAEYNSAYTDYLQDTNNRQNLASDLAIKAEQAREQVIEDQNKAYHSLVGAAVSGLGGAGKIIAAGAGATKLEDVKKKVNEGVQKDIQATVELNKYYDTGGIGGIRGVIDRVKTDIAKKAGIETEYQKIVLDTKALEPQIKHFEAVSSLMKDVKSTADGPEERLKDKIEDLGFTAQPNTIKIINQDGSSGFADVNPGETIASVYRKYKGRAATAKAEAESASKRLEEFETTNATILAQDRSTLTGDALITYDNVKNQRDQLSVVANTKSTAAANAEYAVTLVQKNGARFEYSAILNDFASGRDPKANSAYDQVAVEKAKDMIDSVNVARANSEIVELMKRTLGENSAEYQAFISGKFTSFEQLDTVKTAIVNSANEYDRELKQMKEQKRTSETSNATAAAKASNDYNGGGKK